MCDRLKFATDIKVELSTDLNNLNLSGLSPPNALIAMSTVVSTVWNTYGGKMDSKHPNHPEFNQIKDYYHQLGINIIAANASVPFSRDVRAFLNLFPEDYNIVENYGECTTDVLKSGKCFIFYDLSDVNLLNYIIKGQKIFGDFPGDLERQTPIVSIALTPEYPAKNEFDLVITTTRFDESNPSRSSNYPKFLPKKTSDDHVVIIDEWKKFFQEIYDAAPCIVKYSDELMQTLDDTYGAINQDLIPAILKFVSAYILLRRFSLPKEDIDGIEVFTATLENSLAILDLISEAKFSLNQLARNSSDILTIIQNKYSDNSGFNRKDLLEETGWSPAKLSEALKPLESSGILFFERKGSSHERRYHPHIPSRKK
jgi:hypothetical protein